MAEAEKVMGVSTGDIEKIMGVSTDDIEKIMGVEFPAGLLAYQGDTAFFLTGYGTASSDSLSPDVFTLAVTSTGSTTDAGDLGEEFGWGSAVGSNVSNGNRIVIGGGQNGNASNMIHYITPASYSGGSTDYADLAETKIYAGGASNGTTGMIAMGHSGSNYRAQTDYFTISSTSNAADFGDTAQYGTSPSGSQSLAKAFFSGGFAVWASPSYSNVISTFTFASTGNASDSGDLTEGRQNGTHASGSTEARAIVSVGGRVSGGGFSTEINYMNPASPGDATDFGDSTACSAAGGPGNGVRMVWGGGAANDGSASSTYWQDIHYITIASTGNATESSGTLNHRKYHSCGWTA